MMHRRAFGFSVAGLALGALLAAAQRIPPIRRLYRR